MHFTKCLLLQISISKYTKYNFKTSVKLRGGRGEYEKERVRQARQNKTDYVLVRMMRRDDDDMQLLRGCKFCIKTKLYKKKTRNINKNDEKY